MSRPAYGGDKLGFEEVAELRGTKYEVAQRRFRAIIEAAREKKRDQKDAAELFKERNLLPRDLVRDALKKARLDPKSLEKDPARLSDPTREKERRVGLVVDLVKKGSLPRQLGPLASEIINGSERSEIELAKQILKRYHALVGECGWKWSELEVAFKAKNLAVTSISPTQASVHDQDGTIIAHVWFGTMARLKVKPGEKDGVVLAQRGYDAAGEFEKRRKEYVLDKNGVPTRRFVLRGISHRQLANMLGLDYNNVTRRFERDAREAGQRPRATNPAVFGNHADTLHLGDAEVGRRDQDPSRYDVRSDNGPLPVSGERSYSATSSARPGDTTDHNERSSLQVRNGSGNEQPMLSVAAVQERVPGRVKKIIRGNKGDRFDTSEEGVAVLEIDLAAAARQGITFVNVHSNDSHQYKVAYARYADGSKEIKRSAREELDEYVYSGRKNREVTIDRIPNTIVHAIVLVDERKWAGSELRCGTKLPFVETRSKIADFMTDVHLAKLVHETESQGQLASKL